MQTKYKNSDVYYCLCPLRLLKHCSPLTLSSIVVASCKQQTRKSAPQVHLTCSVGTLHVFAWHTYGHGHSKCITSCAHLQVITDDLLQVLQRVDGGLDGTLTPTTDAQQNN
jgi:hypothetical protein